MREDGIQSYSLFGQNCEASLHQVHGGVGEAQVPVPGELASAGVPVAGEGDVTAEHVVEEDAQGPDGQPVPSVAPLLDPLGRGVDPGAAVLGEHSAGGVVVVGLVQNTP